MKQRKVEIYKDTPPRRWAEIEFKDLKIGDVLRMFEPTGERVEGKDYFEGTDVWVCTRAPYMNGSILTIDCADDALKTSGLGG